MINAIKNYSDALYAHLEAQRTEGVAKDQVKKTRHALVMAREELRAMEAEVLEEQLRKI